MKAPATPGHAAIASEDSAEPERTGAADLFRAHGVKAETIVIEDGSQLLSVARRCAQDGCGVVVAAGGDGTVSAVASAIVGTEATLGVLPLGTLNHFAKDMGILTVGVVTKPFDWEGGRRMTNADNGLAELEANVDSLIVVLNEKLLEVLGDDVTQDEAFAHANDVLKNAVGGIAEIINEYGNVNVDFEDVRTVMGEPGKAMMGTATAAGPDRARIAAEQAVACPLLEGIDLSGAKGVLVLVTASKGSLKLSESRQAMNTINAYASPDAHVIFGAAYDETLGDEIRVTVVATGLSRANARRQPISVVQGGLRTGTDNMAYQIPVAGVGAMGGAMGVQGGHAGGTQADYGSMSVPSVWRTNRTQAAARVDALSSGGMDDLEIPAFLRKQAD